MNKLFSSNEFSSPHRSSENNLMAKQEFSNSRNSMVGLQSNIDQNNQEEEIDNTDPLVYDEQKEYDTVDENSNGSEDAVTQYSPNISESESNHFSFSKKSQFSGPKSQASEEILEDVQDSEEESPLHLPFLIDEDIDDRNQMIQSESEIEKINQENGTFEARECNYFYSATSVQGNRKEMQDKYSAFAQYGDMQYYAVFDGHKNDKIASYLQQNLLSQISSKLSQSIAPQDAISQAFLEMDQLFQNSTEFQDSGCVCVCALIINQYLYIANLGDCRAVLYNKLGNFKNLSIDHTPVMRQDEVERISRQNGICLMAGNQLRVSGELNVTRAFGDKKNKPFILAEPEIFAYEIGILLTEFQYQDVFIALASDGLWNDQNSLKLESLCNQGHLSFPESAISQILEEKECLRDNTTIVAVNLQLYYLSFIHSCYQQQEQCLQQNGEDSQI